MTKQEYIGQRLKRDFIKHVLLREPLFSDSEISIRLLRSLDNDRIYRRLKEAVAQVCDRYLSLDRLKDERGEYVERLPQWLRPELADEIAAEYRRLADSELEYGRIMSALLSRIEKLVWAQGVDDMAANLRRFLDDVRRYANEYKAIPGVPAADAYDIQAKYRAAARVTLREKVTGENDNDIVAFRSALLAYATDLCMAQLYEAMARVYVRIADSRRLHDMIAAFDKAHSSATAEFNALQSLPVNEEYEQVYNRKVPVAFYEQNVEDISGSMAFQMIVFMALARDEQYLRDHGLLTSQGELTIFTSPDFSGNDWMNYDFYRLAE